MVGVLMKNYYEILEVTPEASEEVIKAAYKALVKRMHPDNGGTGTWNGKIRYFIPIPDRYAEHDTHKAVSIQIVVGTVVCGMVKQF